ncbi:MAG TPA: hypothetical protein DEA44_16900, partial [Firmicutes bacterium]|nr:hypothetical protein [Bacillota bacterium]
MATRINIPKWLDKYNRWQIKVRKDGERKTFTCPIPGRKGKIECQRKADAWLEDDVISGDSKVSKLYKQWMEELKVAGGTSHYKQYKSFGDVYIIKKIGNKKTGAVTTQDLQGIILYAYASGNKGKGLSHKTLRGLRSCIIAFIKYARKSKASTLHPEGLYIPKGAKKSKKNILQPNDIAILFSRDTTTSHRKEVPEWYIYAFRFAVVTGLRPGELLGMKRSDITKDVCMIRRSINSHNEITDGKNDNAERSFVLTNTAKQILRDQRKMLSKNSVVSPYIF